MSEDWFGLAALGNPEPPSLAAPDAVLRALVAQDARVELLTEPAELRDGVGAVLRFPVTAVAG